MAKTATLTDAFTTTFDTAKWTALIGTVTIAGGALKCEYATAAYDYAIVRSNTTYDLTASTLMVQIADIGTRQTGWQAILAIVGAGSNNSARIYVSDQFGVVAQVYNAGTAVFDTAGVAFDAAIHKWLQLREASGILYFETSANGVNWTVAHSTSTSVISGWSLAAVSVDLQATRSTAQASNGYSSFDNLNVVPATPQGNFFRFFGGYTDSIGGDPAAAPPPSGGGSAYIQNLTDLDWLQWEPTGQNLTGAVPENSSFQRITTPSGPGFQIVCTDSNETNWNTQARAVLAMKNNVTALGTTTDWTWDMYLPTQTINVTPYVLWEFHTATSSGHFIGIRTDNTYRLCRQTASGGNNYVIIDGPAARFDAWTPCRIQCKWSLAGDGFLKMWIDGTQYVNYTGATQFSGDGTPYLQFGWYGVRPAGVTNTVKFANIQRTVT